MRVILEKYIEIFIFETHIKIWTKNVEAFGLQSFKLVHESWILHRLKIKLTNDVNQSRYQHSISDMEDHFSNLGTYIKGYMKPKRKLVIHDQLLMRYKDKLNLILQNLFMYSKVE